MSLRSTCTEIFGYLLAALALLFVGGGAHAQLPGIEKALSPGPVIEGHAKYEHRCDKCHKRFDKAAQTQLCADCHKKIAADIRSRTRFHGHLKDTACRNCHTDHKGRTAKVAAFDKDKFDHDRTGFKLLGSHRQTRNKCADCHKAGKKYRDTPSDCYSCHRKDDDAKGHKGRLGHKCERCHNETKWAQISFDHDKTRFKLDGEHVAVTCRECHHDNKFKNTPRQCYACHKKDDNDDGHHGNFGTKCEKCHTTDGWREPDFDHNRDTDYRLRGRHVLAACDGCHKGELFKKKAPTKCVACHRKDDDNKGHKGSLGTKCESCHNEQSWKANNFNHDKDTKYPLEGKHRTAKCESCHKSGLKPAPGTKTLEKLPTKCAECHRKDDDEKGHRGKFGVKCETCHTPKGWKRTTFVHNRDTKYPLRGKHRDAKCNACHTVQLYVEKTPTACVACHRKDDNEKGHKGTLGDRCDNCHHETGWKVENFDHKRSRFLLSGAHEHLECKKCHRDLAFRNTPRDCYGCHKKDDDDKGHQGRFGTKCDTCHNERLWQSWDFDHDTTKFPLVGGHKKVDCYGCHKRPIKGRAAIDRSCIACHAKDDAHGGGFGSQCEICHVADSWKKILR
jgi:hypothetical protein